MSEFKQDKFNKDLSSMVGDFISFLEKNTEEYYSSLNAEHELFNSRMDMIHTLELEELTYHQVAHLALDIRDISRTRRTYKDEFQLKEPIAKFIKDNSKIIETLKKLQTDLAAVEDHMKNKHYNTRQKIKGIETLTRDGSIKNKNKEDLINLNRIIAKFSNVYESEIEKYATSEDDTCELIISVWFNDCLYNSRKQLKDKMMFIRNDIDKFFGSNYENKQVSLVVSDMLSLDKKSKHKLESKLTISTSGKDVYHIRLRAYGVIVEEKKKSSSKKKSKKRR